MNPTRTSRPRVAFATLGCKVNQAESEAIGREFASAGYELVDFDGHADAYILNSCTVTHIADRKSRQLVRQARRRNPAGVILVTGCYAAVDGKDMAATIGADLVVGNDQKDGILALVRQRLQHRLADAGVEECLTAHPLALPQDASLDPVFRTRAMVKVQDGCNNFCSYCVVPLARGRERSVPPGDVLAEVRGRVEAGYKEVVLTGVHAGAYGKGLPEEVTLAALVERLLKESSVQRLRLSSIEPWDLDPALLGFLGDKRFCRHFHLPLQSGSDSVLQRMRRRYTAGEFAALVKTVRAADPDVAITTDVIVGFPGETEAEFAESLQFCREMGFARMHVFRYSPRKRTRAADLGEQIDERVKKSRSEAMMALSDEGAAAFRRCFIGKSLEVLWEDARVSGRPEGKVWTGLTDNYLRVEAPCLEEIGNRLLPATILRESGDDLWGEIT